MTDPVCSVCQQPADRVVLTRPTVSDTKPPEITGCEYDWRCPGHSTTATTARPAE